MTACDIYCKHVYIGLLEIDDCGQHKYTPIIEGIEIIEKIVPLPSLLLDDLPRLVRAYPHFEE